MKVNVAVLRTWALWTFIFLGLTLTTQIGGVVIVGSWFLFRHRIFVKSTRPRLWAALCSGGIYVLATFLLVPLAAALVGRVPMPVFASLDRPIAARSWLYCLCNRHYVDQRLHDAVVEVAKDFNEANPGFVIYYLDANFPFVDGFPLLPHLSHDDGRKLDFTYCYHERGFEDVPALSPSPIGYWVYEPPEPGEAAPYRGRGSWLRWDFGFLQEMNRGREFDARRTAEFLRLLLDHPETEKVLLEIHLQERLQLESPKLRFQQLNAARHDDHVHYQIRRE